MLAWFNREEFVYTLAPPLLEHDPVDEFLFDTRRGFCEHYASAFVAAAARRRHSRARRHRATRAATINPRGGYMIVRQSDAHAWAEALIDGRWQRFDPTAAVAPSRIEIGLGGALPAGERCRCFARLDDDWLKNVQLAWDAFNHDWRATSSASTATASARCGATGSSTSSRHGRSSALMSRWRCSRGARLLVGWLMWKRRRQERALVLWDDLNRRLARAGLPRQSHEGPLAYAHARRARWPQFAIAFAAIGESFATLRYGSRSPDPRERDALVATLERAIEVLPAPARLRTTRSG